MNRLRKKTRAKKSHETVPLSLHSFLFPFKAYAPNSCLFSMRIGQRRGKCTTHQPTVFHQEKVMVWSINFKSLNFKINFRGTFLNFVNLLRGCPHQHRYQFQADLIWWHNPFKGTVAWDFQPPVFFSHKSVVPGPLIHILKYFCHLLLFRWVIGL